MKIQGIFAIIVALIFIFHFSTYTKLQNQFQHWSKKFNIKFNENQKEYRYKIFTNNLAKINQHNSKLDKEYTQGVNQFAALTHEEFVAQYLLSYIPSQKFVEQDIREQKQNGPVVDWVTYGAVSPVKNQGSCKASYAFSAVGAIEGLSVILYKAQQQFSVQQVVDCSQNYKNNGCVNGRMDYTFAYVRDKGINLQSSYPYIGRLSQCKVASGFFKIKSFYTITNNCNNLANALMVNPISVAVDGSNFQFYSFGVFNNCKTNLTLGALLVGMTDGYWNVKNSWGTSWGQNGYIRLSRGNTCGICIDASYPA